MKFGKRLSTARTLGLLLARTVAKELTVPPPTVLIPVPLHRRRRQERGFDQALEIGLTVGRELGVPVSRDSLVRIRETAPQTRLDAKARRKNVSGAFGLRRCLDAAYVVIVDDVITTGSTVGEVAVTLLRAGARRVEAWACARADRSN